MVDKDWIAVSALRGRLHFSLKWDQLSIISSLKKKLGVATFVCYPQTLHAIETIKNESKEQLMRCLMSAYDKRTWVHTTWILVRFWRVSIVVDVVVVVVVDIIVVVILMLLLLLVLLLLLWFWCCCSSCWCCCCCCWYYCCCCWYYCCCDFDVVRAMLKFLVVFT